jgi:SPP1 gp7 family putative phage head morphogenesis protein
MWKVGANPLAPKKAIEFFKAKAPLKTAVRQGLEERIAQQAFTVANVTQLDVIHTVWQELEKAIENGSTLAEFRTNAQAALEAAWGEKVTDPSGRVETIFRTNVATAYSAGRQAQMDDPDVKAIRRYRLFDAVVDGRTSDLCGACDGTILPADDPWWDTHTPPLHHRCRSQVITLTEEQARAQGGVTGAPSAEASAGFGAPVKTRSETWQPTKDDYPPELYAALQAKLATVGP